MNTIRIDSQFNGPPDSGNGGYCAGMFAAPLTPGCGEAIEVSLYSPPPLNQSMGVRDSNKGIEVVHGDTLVASARSCELAIESPPPPTLAQAREAAKNYSGFKQHPFPGCFVCGTARTRGDGLCVFPGPLADHSQVCTPWQPFSQLANTEGMLRPEFIWAALDCPSYFGGFIDQENTPALLGRFSLAIYQQQIPADQEYIVTAWPLGMEGRKCFGGSGLFSQQGDCLALARGIWIVIS